MTLSDYISETGDDVAALRFCVSERTAASWRRGERFPRPDKAFEIERITAGAVSFAECFERSTVQAA